MKKLNLREFKSSVQGEVRIELKLELERTYYLYFSTSIPVKSYFLKIIIM